MAGRERARAGLETQQKCPGEAQAPVMIQGGWWCWVGAAVRPQEAACLPVARRAPAGRSFSVLVLWLVSLPRPVLSLLVVSVPMCVRVAKEHSMGAMVGEAAGGVGPSAQPWGLRLQGGTPGNMDTCPAHTMKMQLSSFGQGGGKKGKQTLYAIY